MKRSRLLLTRLLLVLLPVLLGVPLWFAKRTRENSTPYILSHYAQMGEGAIRADHIQVQELQQYPNPIVLRTTWYPLKSSHGICAPASSVRADGSVTAWVDACGPTDQRALPRLDPNELFAVLRRLPPMQRPLNHTYSLILTFCVDGVCTTRVYDRTNLPTEVKQIFALTGAPLETAKPLP